MAIKAVKGVKDILPERIGVWRRVEADMREVFARFGFREIALPIFEKSEVFIKSVGETTDIVQKEMYTFEDRGGDSLTLRPEGTASAVRAYIEHSMYHPQGNVTQLYYFGPMFRRERPQAGRFRQFHQIGAELFGSDDPSADSTVIHLLMLLLESAGLKESELLLNSLGCRECRPEFTKALVAFLSERKGELCDLCLERYENNPLRVLDCKNENCGEVVNSAPTIDQHLCGDCQTHFIGVKENLDALGIEYKIDLRMVRGLDYYNRTVFEVIAKGLGAQNSVAGGGRYDSLVKTSGGPQVPATGFAIGMERLLESANGLPEHEEKPDAYIAIVSKNGMKPGMKIAGELRNAGMSVEHPYKQGGMKNQMSRANKAGAKVAIILGEDEIQKGTAMVKNLASGEQEETALDGAVDVVSRILTATDNG
jgi:histidyl-tRNA synthetase